MSDFKVVQLLNPIQINTNINPTGVYNNATSYGPGDSVSFGNSSYICILATTGNDPTNTAYWQLLASSSTNKLSTTARNVTGATIPKGSVVYFNGSSGNLPTIALAQANTEASSSRTVGLTSVAIPNNSNGEIVVIGLIESLDTSAFTVGIPLWLSPTVAGGMTNTEPVAPDHSVFIGVCTRSNPTQGTIEINIQNGQKLEELHNVLINGIANNQYLRYESASSLWKNHTLTSSDVGLGSVNNTSDANKPISTATQTALDLKVDKVVGKGLSTEDYTSTEKTKLAGIASGATANQTDAFLLNRTNHTGTQGPGTIVQDASNRFTTDAEKATWNGKQDALGFTPANDTLSNLGGTAVNNPINPDSNIAYTLGASGLNWLSVATKGILYDDSPNYDVELRNFVDSATKNSLNYEARNLLDKGGILVLDWDNCFIDKERFGLLGITFETVSKNLKQYNYALNYTSGTLTSIVYTVPSVGTITKTLNYTSGLLTSVVLSGSTPLSIQLTKTLTYTSGVLTSIAYT
jgi:hypothetical protein